MEEEEGQEEYPPIRQMPRATGAAGAGGAVSYCVRAVLLRPRRPPSARATLEILTLSVNPSGAILSKEAVSRTDGEYSASGP